MNNTTSTSGGQPERIFPSPVPPKVSEEQKERLADLAPLIEQGMRVYQSENRKTLRVQQRFEFKQFIVRSVLLALLMCFIVVVVIYFLRAERFDIAENAFYAILGTLGIQWIGPTRRDE